MDPNAEDARQYIEAIGQPATREDFISNTGSNGAPEKLVGRLGPLGTRKHADPDEVATDEVVRELRSSPTSG